MNTRNLLFSVKAVLLVWVSAFALTAEGATAVASVTANIVPRAEENGGMAISARELNLHGKTNDEITIYNRSDIPHNLQIELSSLSGSNEGCQIRYSPMSFSIPPGGYQVVRIVMLTKNGKVHHTAHQLDISDMTLSGMRLFSVAVDMVN